MHDYATIAKAIRFLETHRSSQPDLSLVAAHVGMEASQFERLFSDWARAAHTDPMRCLSLSHARGLLRRGADVLDATPGGGGVILDAATPDEARSGGTGLAIRAGISISPFGNCLIADSPRGICHLAFFDDGERESALAEMRADWPQADVSRDDGHAAKLCGRLFHSPAEPWRLFVRGTPFQLRVWRALLQVPPGTLVSYAKLAAASGNPQAARATGSAVGRNAVSFLIPCHRVVRESGHVGDYRWGAVRKRAMLAWECCRAGG